MITKAYMALFPFPGACSGDLLLDFLLRLARVASRQAISTKVLAERLRKLLAYGLIIREDYSGVILHVEYRLTPAGARLATIIDQLYVLQKEHSARIE